MAGSGGCTFVSAENCFNNRDDDCNGSVDEGNPQGGASCSTGLYGACDVGEYACQNGGLVCTQTVTGSDELCNGIDDDCNGATDEDCDFGCQITNTCNFFSCETQTCSAAKCLPASAANVPKNVGLDSKFMNPMVTVHWNGDRDEAEDFEHTFRSLLGAGDCDGVEDLPDKCIGALVMRSNVAKPQEVAPDLGTSNRGLSPRLDHMADYIYSLTSFVRNPNLEGGPSPAAIEGAKIFFSSISRNGKA